MTFSKQVNCLSLALKKWPDALKHCRDSILFGNPLHEVTRTDNGTYGSRMQCIDALMRGSSLEELSVIALVATNVRGRSGFQCVKDAIDCKSSEVSSDWSNYMDETFKILVQRKDHHGRTLLHYLAEKKAEVNEEDFRKREEEFVDDTSRIPSDDEWAALQEERKRLEKRNRGQIVEVCQWILTIDVSAAHVVDSNGMNPFHYATSKGKTWNDGLEDLAKLVPCWPQSKKKRL